MKKITDVLIIIFAAFLSAVGLHTFIHPAGFAAVGVDGIAIMLQDITGIGMGYISLLINIPLLIAAWFILSKKYVIYTLAFIITSSAMLIIADKIAFYEYFSAGNLWISVIVSGILHGVRTGLMIKNGGSAGGVDIIACIIQKRKPYLNIENSILGICYLICFMTFLVYHNIESVIMSVIHLMVFNAAMAYVMKPTRNAVKVTIITDNPNKIKNEILTELKHGATIVPCRGVYSEKSKSMIISIINIRQMNELLKIAQRHRNTFIYYDDINGVWGNFRWNKDDPVI